MSGSRRRAGPSGGRRDRATEARGRGRGDRGVGGEQVEGRRAVHELLAAGARPVRSVWVQRGLDPDARLDEIAALAGPRLRWVSASQLAGAARSEAPQGVVARADPLPDADLDALLAATGAFLVALDGVTDPRNLGAVLRVAETAGATGVVLPRHRSARITPAAAKAAAGAIEHLPVATVPGIAGALERARRAGVWAVGLDAGADRSLFDLALAVEPIVLVLGAEGKGLSRLARERCDLLVAAPMRGRIESLNVATAAALACHEVARRRAATPGDTGGIPPG